MLNEHAMGTYRQMSRIGAPPPLGVLAQLGRYRSMGVAPNVVAQGMQQRQASLINGARNPMLALMALQLRGGY